MMNRREAREAALALIFESEFQGEALKEEILELARGARELEDDEYVRSVFFASVENREQIDEKIARFAVGRSIHRISKVALAVMRLSITEMLFLPESYTADLPYWVSINEALELVKRYDHDVPPAFVNGILNAVAEEGGLKTQTRQEGK